MVSKVCFVLFKMSHHDPYPVYEMLRWAVMVCVSYYLSGYIMDKCSTRRDS